MSANNLWGDQGVAEVEGEEKPSWGAAWGEHNEEEEGEGDAFGEFQEDSGWAQNAWTEAPNLEHAEEQKDIEKDNEEG